MDENKETDNQGHDNLAERANEIFGLAEGTAAIGTLSPSKSDSVLQRQLNESPNTGNNVDPPSVMPKPPLYSPSNGSAVSSNGHTLPAIDIDTRNCNVQLEQQERHHSRHGSISERRNFHTPFSIPFGSPHSTGAIREMDTLQAGRHAGVRKTSLPAGLPKPTDLEIIPAIVDEFSRLVNAHKRYSESSYVPFGLDERNFAGGSQDAIQSHYRKESQESGAASFHHSFESVAGELPLQDTQIVVQTFIAATYQRDIQFMVAAENDDDSPVVAEAPVSASVMTGIVTTPDLPLELQAAPLSPTAEVGRRLALLGDEFDKRYGAELGEMVIKVLPHILGKTGSNVGNSWSLTFDAFRNVARSLFEGCQITWGRIIALLSFGYRLVASVLRAGFPGFVRRIIDLVSKFIIVEPIANWIYRQGGWIQALFFQPQAENPQLQVVAQIAFWSVQALAAALIVINWWARNR